MNSAESAGSVLKQPRVSAAGAASGILLEQIIETLGEAWLPRFYKNQILTLRTRAFHFPPKLKFESVTTERTLLGIELKAGQHRIACPDLATARYLAVFARANCSDVAVPYDITAINRLADDLEGAWEHLLSLIARSTEERSAGFRSRLRTRLLGEIKTQVESAGAGPELPRFNHNTKQRQPLI